MPHIKDIVIASKDKLKYIVDNILNIIKDTSYDEIPTQQGGTEFIVHKFNDVKHITSEEREKWNSASIRQLIVSEDSKKYLKVENDVISVNTLTGLATVEHVKNETTADLITETEIDDII